MLQRLLTVAIILICILWIVVSYLPSVQAFLPVIAFAQSNQWLATLAVLSLLIFVAIQIWLVYTTMISVRTFQANSQSSPFRLKLGTELFWTALPIAITIGLAWASYPRWLHLAKP